MVVKKPEVQEDSWAEEPKAPVTPVVVQTGEGKITVTLKAGPGFEVPWIVRHANTVAEAVEFMQDEQLDELMDLTARKAKEFAKAFGGGPVAAKPAASSGGWGAKKPAAKSGPSNDAPDCEHGERTWVDKGAWRAWMCPAERDDPSKCDPIWANPDGSPQPAKKRR